jgi:hypothetical protein
LALVALVALQAEMVKKELMDQTRSFLLLHQPAVAVAEQLLLMEQQETLAVQAVVVVAVLALVLLAQPIKVTLAAALQHLQEVHQPAVAVAELVQLALLEKLSEQVTAVMVLQ